METAEAKLEDVDNINTYLTNFEGFEKYNKVYQEFFTGNLPVKTTIGRDLKGIPIEIDAITAM